VPLYVPSAYGPAAAVVVVIVAPISSVLTPALKALENVSVKVVPMICVSAAAPFQLVEKSSRLKTVVPLRGSTTLSIVMLMTAPSAPSASVICAAVAALSSTITVWAAVPVFATVTLPAVSMVTLAVFFSS